jgi:hypothetical protein
MLNAAAKYPKNNRYHNTPSTLEDVTWDRYTFKLPVVLANPATAHPSVKDRFYRATLEGISAATQASSLTKINVLSSRFEFPHLIHEIDGSLSTLYDNTTGTDNHIVVLPHPQVFTFSRPSLRNEQGQELVMPNANAANLANAVRRNTRFYSFQLTINAHTAYDGPARIRDASSLETIVLNAAISVPSILINIPQHVDDGLEVIPPELTADILRNPTLTLQTLAHLNNNIEPILGTLAKPAGQFLVSIQHTQFRKEFMEYFNLCRYKLFRELLRSEFLGKSIIDTSYVVNELQSFRQNRYDTTTRRYITNTVEEYYGSFTAAVNLLPYNHLYPVDIAMLFWNGLSPDIRQQGEAVEYTPPSRPQGQVETNQQADTRLRTVKDAAVRFEKQLDTVKMQVNRVRGSMYQMKGQANTFVTLPHQTMHNPVPGYAPFPTDDYTPLDTTMFPPIDPDFDHGNPDPITPLDTQHPDPLVTASIYLSVAEEAMRNATGSSVPPLECWGCTDHPNYHGNRFHRWMDCPYRGDPSVAANAKKGLQQFIDKRKATRRPSNANSHWQQRGYPNRATAQLITSIADPRTLPSQRQAYIHYLTHPTTETATTTPNTNNDTELTPPDADITPGLPPSFSFPIRILTAIQTPPELQLSISQVMPHIKIPIGKSSRSATLCCMVDSGAGLSLGRLSYHKSIHSRHPDLVHSWLDMKDSPSMEEFTIGGIDSKGTPTKVTSMISYNTPFTINGQAVHIQFALAEDVASNAIIGIPFLRSTCSSLLFAHDTMVSQRLGHTFNIFYQIPHQADIAPITSPDATAVFPAMIRTPPHISQDLLRSGRTLANTFTMHSNEPPSRSPTEPLTRPYHIAPGLLLNNPDLEDVYSNTNDGDEWIVSDETL